MIAGSELAAVMTLITERSGLVFPDLRRTTALETIGEFMKARGLADASALIAGGQLPALLEGLVVHESFFDRDAAQLSFVDEVIFAGVARATDATLRVWSAACAGGEEAYTLAFMLATRGLLERSKVLGTDLSEAALERARRGRYRAWSNRLGPASPAARYLEPVATEFQVPARFLDAVRFARMNLVEDSFPSGQHVILCRNVLIYFSPSSIERVANKLAAALDRDGWLVVGPSEPRLDHLAPLDLVINERGLFYRVRTRARPVVREVLPASVPVRVPARPVVAPVRPTAPIVPTTRAVDEIRRLADLGDYPRARDRLEAALATSPLDPELHFLDGVLASERDPGAALAALARCIYLDPGKAAAQLLMASLWRARGQQTDARRAYRAALQIVEKVPGAELVPWVEETAGSLSTACRRALEVLDGTG